VLRREVSLADLKGEVEAAEPLERIVVRPSASEGEDDAELVLGKGGREEEVVSLVENLRGVWGYARSTPP
jgi:hypothetical protein